MTVSSKGIAALAAVCVAACSPALDWREFVPEDSGLRVTFPCRPDRQMRTVQVAGASVRMDMLVCAANGATYAVSFADLPDPARLGAALAELRAAAVSNLEGRSTNATPFQIRGMTPSDQALRLKVAGRLPDGTAVEEHAAFFARGVRVFQAAVVGPRPEAPAVEPFFDGLMFPTERSQ